MKESTAGRGDGEQGEETESRDSRFRNENTIHADLRQSELEGDQSQGKEMEKMAPTFPPGSRGGREVCDKQPPPQGNCAREASAGKQNQGALFWRIRAAAEL